MARREVPLIAGRIHGIRVWELEWVAGDARLEGFNGAEWVAGGRPTVAVCTWSGLGVHRAPHHDCGCGLYAAHPDSAEFAFALLYDAHTPPLGCIAGIVEAWGRVELHKDGFRAEFARPVALALVGAPAESDLGAAVARLADRYASEVLVLDDYAGLAAYCRRHELGLARPVVQSLLADSVREQGPPRSTHRRPSAPRSRPSRVLSALRSAARLTFGLALLGALLVFGIRALVGLIAALDSHPELQARHLAIAEQALIRRGDELRYVAVVRNTSAKRVAVAAFARGEVADRTGSARIRLGRPERAETRPTLLPGETGVVIDTLRGRHAAALHGDPRFEVTMVSRRAPAREARQPFVVRSTRLHRESCRLGLRLEARGPVTGAEVALVARERSGAITAGGVMKLGMVPAGRSHRTLLNRRPDGCPPWPYEVDVYPHLLPEHLDI